MDARAHYDEICDDLVMRNDDVSLGQMMGMPCAKRGGKIVAGFWPAEQVMVFKLEDAARREAALALEGAHLFDPSGKGRPFREWVAVPVTHSSEWERLAQEALHR
jgi:hypothetical protein